MIARAILVLTLLAGSAGAIFTGAWWLAPAWAMVFGGFVLFCLAAAIVYGTERAKKK
ncbi:MAG TPA: hypothetical protein VM487_18365 [Phycisphaerae bacterium]|nr:hypothetical protein [Phycisphaerae bacterium]